MKNMCLEQLVLVAPRQYPSPEAIARASGADDILARARVTDDLDAAVGDCRLVVGASARLRSVEWPQLDPRACALTAWREAAAGSVALVFGRENSGLTNDELARCRYLLHIPANPEYSSLNLAMAVQVVAYELLMAARAAEAPAEARPERATAEQLQGLFDHLRQAIGDIGFTDPRHSDRLMRRLRRLFLRAEPDPYDVNILRGILSAAQGRKSMRR
jgi:tRNA (cytidine32/uridine32-2'-O)-methyltransferase